MTKLEHAIAAARRGLPVFPLGAQSRKPVIREFPAQATVKEQPIAAWWAKHPGHNIAVLTGERVAGGDFLAVVDIDRHAHDGFAAIASLEAEYGALPETFSVDTPRGGRHLYFTTPQPLKCTQSKIGQGLDVRGYHGYVVAPGSFHQGLAKTYTVSADKPIAPMPQWMVDLNGVYSERELSAAPIVETDDATAVHRAIDYLQSAADKAVEGDGGDLATYRVAARLKDLGLSQPTVFALMRDYWNENQTPPWSLAELEQKTFNAYRYGTKANAEDNPEADFATFDDSQPFGGKTLPKAGLPIEAYEEDVVRPRPWVAGHIAQRGQVTLLVAPPGVGKSTLTIGLALSCASNRPLLGDCMRPHARTPVLLWNNEDDKAEINRRMKAARIHFQVEPKDLLTEDHRPALFVRSSDERGLTVVRREGKSLQSADAHLLQKAIIDTGAGLVIIDPFAETHQANENDNGEMMEVMKVYRKIAVKTNAALVLVHHSKKPPMASTESYAGDMNTGRGASSVVGVARIVYTLYGMSRKDARLLGINENQKHLYVRLDSAKANHALSAGTDWFKKVSVNVPAPTEHDPLNTEPVGVLDPVELAMVEEDNREAKALLLDINEEVDQAMHLRELARRLRLLDRYADRDRNFSREIAEVVSMLGQPFRLRVLDAGSGKRVIREARRLHDKAQ